MRQLKGLLRRLLGQKLNYGVIIISLAIGLACVNLISLFLKRELGTDKFHKNNALIYSLNCDDPWGKGGIMSQCKEGSAEYIVENFTGIQQFCRMKNASPVKVVVNNEAYFDKPIAIATSANFFDFFSYKLLTNNPQTVLETKSNLVISEELAEKYFGVSDPVGKSITFANRESEDHMIVTGVFQKPIENTQLNFDMVRLSDQGDSRCFIRLTPDANPQKIEELFKENKKNIPVIHGGTPGQYYLEPFHEFYFKTSGKARMEANRDKTDLWVAFVIGLLIISIAVFNYLGLLNNILNEKQKEFAIRKVNGGSKWSFIYAFTMENLVLISFSFLISIPLMVWMMPFFNKLTGTQISVSFMVQPFQILICIAVVSLLVFSSFALAMIRIRLSINMESLKPSSGKKGKRSQIPAFNIVQLAGSVILIVSSFIIMKQMNYIANKPIGLNKDVFEVKIPGAHKQSSDLFKEELSKYSSVESVSKTGASPVLEHYLLLLKYEEDGSEKQYIPAGFSGDENYISTLGIELIEGESFSNIPDANKNKVLINQSLANLFPDKNLPGAALPGMKNKVVCGIVKDFHYSNLKSVVAPAIISFDNKGGHLMVKTSENQNLEATNAIAQTWEKLIPDYPLNIETIGDRYAWFHRENRNYILLIGACCSISIFLSMIGLFAISYQTSQARTKEIGIRKVNGAKISEILAMLNKDFIRWVLISFVFACPIAWYAMNRWLENFAYKTTLSWWIFALAGLSALEIALLTVSFQSWRAAARNPVEALRYE